MSKKNIAVIFGGRSVEHEISMISGIQLVEAMDRELYNPIPVYIAHSGKWFTGDQLLDKQFYRGLPNCLENLDEVTLIPNPEAGGLTILKSANTSFLSSLSSKKEKVIPVDVYIPAFHGTYGEDGCIQGLFEMADAAYAGSDVLASAVAMDKSIAKYVAAQNGIPVLPSVLISKNEFQTSVSKTRSKIIETEGLSEFPLFIKPVHLGSSIGISKANNEQELDAGLVQVFRYDDKAIIEPCVVDIMEINISILDTTEKRIASVTEIPVGTDGVLSYEDKYLQNSGGKKGAPSESQGMANLSRVIDPQDLDPNIKERVQEYALKFAEVINSSGVGRYDFIIDTSTNKVYFNELNPIPGSFSFYLWEKSKPPVIYTQLINRLIDRAIDRKASLASYEKDTGFKALFK